MVQGRQVSSPLALPGLSLVVASRSEALPSLAGISISLLPFLALWAGGSVLLSSTGMGFFSEMCPLGEEGSCRCVCPQREALVEIWPVARHCVKDLAGFIPRERRGLTVQSWVENLTSHPAVSLWSGSELPLLGGGRLLWAAWPGESPVIWHLVGTCTCSLPAGASGSCCANGGHGEDVGQRGSDLGCACWGRLRWQLCCS